ncbi:hypothetical protein IWX46DRAFT_658494, partial [Phyllosticta citricarpa]
DDEAELCIVTKRICPWFCLVLNSFSATVPQYFICIISFRSSLVFPGAFTFSIAPFYKLIDNGLESVGGEVLEDLELCASGSAIWTDARLVLLLCHHLRRFNLVLQHGSGILAKRARLPIESKKPLLLGLEVSEPLLDDLLQAFGAIVDGSVFLVCGVESLPVDGH